MQSPTLHHHHESQVLHPASGPPFLHPLISLPPAHSLTNQHTFCASNVIHHFFWGNQPVLKLSCSSCFVKVITVMTEGLAVIMFSCSCIIVSYLRILITVLKIPSAAGKHNAVSSCGSHLTVMTLFYKSISYVYFQPLFNYSVKDRLATIIYTILTLMLNPFIYSLRNKDMKQGWMKIIHRVMCK